MAGLLLGWYQNYGKMDTIRNFFNWVLSSVFLVLGLSSPEGGTTSLERAQQAYIEAQDKFILVQDQHLPEAIPQRNLFMSVGILVSVGFHFLNYTGLGDRMGLALVEKAQKLKQGIVQKWKRLFF